MENGETYDPDLDLEAEIEAFLDEDITEITEPLWKAEPAEETVEPEPAVCAGAGTGAGAGA